MEKSVAYKATTVRAITGTLVVASSAIKWLTISLVKPSMRRLKVTMIDARAMMGRLRPHLDVDWSEMAPIIGCTIRPDNGPAIQTTVVCPLVRPKERR